MTLTVGKGVWAGYGDVVIILERRPSDILVTIVDNAIDPPRYVERRTTGCLDLLEAKRGVLELANRYLGIEQDLAADWVWRDS